MIHCDRVWAEVDLDAILSNIENIKKNIKKDTKIIAVMLFFVIQTLLETKILFPILSGIVPRSLKNLESRVEIHIRVVMNLSFFTFSLCFTLRVLATDSSVFLGTCLVFLGGTLGGILVFLVAIITSIQS